MKMRGFFDKAVFGAIVVSLTSLTAFALPSLQNGNFSEGLDYWTADPCEAFIAVVNGKAFFQESAFFETTSGTLSQTFTIPDFALTLSFEFQYFLSEGLDETDVFTASLLDPDTMVSLTTDPNFFYWDSEGNILTEATLSYPGDPNTIIVALDIPSSLYGEDALLFFSLLIDEDVPYTKIFLDNVSVSIPAPGSLVLGFVGTAVVGL